MERRCPIVLTTGIQGDDGISLLSREVASALPRTNADSAVKVWSLTDSGVDNLSLRSAGGRRLRYAWWGLEEGLRSQGGRTVVTLHAHLLPVALPIVYRGARLFHFLVGIDAWKALSWPQVAALRRASKLVAISGHSAAEFRRANPRFESSELSVCHPGLPDVESGRECPGRAYALIVGRMSREERYKGHDLLLEIWGEVRARHPQAELLVAGGGDDLPRLETKAKQLGLERSVRFLGKVPSADLDRLYRDCTFFVMPSRHEGFGFVFLEAMRAGKAAIGARGAAGEIIEDGLTGYVVDPNDRRALISTIGKLWSDPAARERMGAKGRERFLSRFTRERFQERLRAIMERD